MAVIRNRWNKPPVAILRLFELQIAAVETKPQCFNVFVVFTILVPELQEAYMDHNSLKAILKASLQFYLTSKIY